MTFRIHKEGAFRDEGPLSLEFRRKGRHGAVRGNTGPLPERHPYRSLFRLQPGRPAGGKAAISGRSLPPRGDAPPVRLPGGPGAGIAVPGVGHRPGPLPIPAGALHRPAG